MNKKSVYWGLLCAGIAAVLAACATQLSSSDDTALSGVVTSRNGAEAGVWVIAETTDLPTKFAKMVVTDDNGRYVMPDLPKANYQVWVRGYGLVDSAKVSAAPGRGLSGILCARHIMLAERIGYAQSCKEDAKSQRCCASGGVYRDTGGAA